MAPLKTSVVTSYDQKSKKNDDKKSNDYFNVSVEIPTKFVRIFMKFLENPRKFVEIPSNFVEISRKFLDMFRIFEIRAIL